VRVEPAPLTSRWRDRAPFNVEHDTDAAFGIAEGYEETYQAPASVIDPEPELTLDELIAGDPGPEPGQPGWESLEPVGHAPPADTDEAARSAAELDGATLSSDGAATAAGSDAAEALRMAVLETR
jgi:hypothetical protein